MRLLSTIANYQAVYVQWAGKKVALVPTMGALHEGHQALIQQARQLGEIVVVSIFVNPLQFGPSEDLAAYPRPLEQDLAICRALGVDAVFHPDAQEMYPLSGESVYTVVPPETLTERYCGAFRPGHFTGVATVVLKLFNILRPHLVIFGEKDAQQLAVIRAMVRDLQVPVEIVAHPTVRDETGLALSSRNQYLKTSVEQSAARLLYWVLDAVQLEVKASSTPLRRQATLETIASRILSQWTAPEVQITLQYLDAVDAETFRPVDFLSSGNRVLIAAYVNRVRLIDNLLLS